MKIPLSWLQEFVRVPVEPKKLAEDLAFIGMEVASVASDGKDTVLDLEITTNRVDCMNVYGVAREIAVLYDQPLQPLPLEIAESGAPAAEALDVAIEAGDLCPRFGARVLDVRMAPSPAWLRDRLEQVGVRPISNVVDLTNYVMMEMGQPTHAFDLAKVPGARLVVRFAKDGETLKTLDGVERKLSARTGVVAGGDGALALAGIMGGASSEVGDSTKGVALEAAYWDPLIIRRAAKALGMHTEASHRFERGSDPEAPAVALARLAHLLQKIGGGSVRPGLIDRVASARPRRKTVLRPARLNQLLGTEVPVATTKRILVGLGFTLAGRSALPGEDNEFDVTVPSWRGDVAREVDLVEEVGRHHGLDKIPATLPAARSVEGLRPHQRRERAVRDVLAGGDVSEVISYAFVSVAGSAPVPGTAVPLVNPLSEDQAVMRRSLVVPGLLSVLAANLRQGRRDVRVFEIGSVFFPDQPLPAEEKRVAVLLHGAAREAHWSDKTWTEKVRPADFFDAKGLVEAMGRRLGATLAFEREGVPPYLHPGQSAAITSGGARVGSMGVLHPDTVRAWELREAPVVVEMALDALLAAPAPAVRFEALPRFPAVTRDLSLLCDEGRAAASIEKEVQAAAGPLLLSVAVVDRYVGTPVPNGKTSLTITLRYQHPTRTLTGEEVQQSVDQVVAALRASGATVRGE
jgi:phenylalanyl-tRNA synthetase beta chain